MSFLRRCRRENQREAFKLGKRDVNKLFDDSIGKTMNSQRGVIRLAGGAYGLEQVVNDWNSQETGVKSDYLDIDMDMDTGTKLCGIENIKSNAGLIKKSPGIKDFSPAKKDIFFLIGAGYSALKFKHLFPKLRQFGTVISTNLALKHFVEMPESLDLAFLMDSKSDIFKKQAWWDKLDKSNIECIAAFNTHPSVLEFKNHFFFSQGSGMVPEWQQEAEKNNVEVDSYGALDCGWNWLFSCLHFCHGINPRATIVSLGNDFAYVDNWKYFDIRHSIKDCAKGTRSPQWKIIVACDHEGNTILSNKDLETQCKLNIQACRNFTAIGGRVINGSPGGLFWAKSAGIEQIPLNEFLDGLK